MRLDHITQTTANRPDLCEQHTIVQSIVQLYFSPPYLIAPERTRTARVRRTADQTCLLDDHSELEPPDPIPNSEVKRLSADGSVGLPHVRVGHRQALILNTPNQRWFGVFFYVDRKNIERLADDLAVIVMGLVPFRARSPRLARGRL